MLKLCKLRSRDRARDLQEATNSILVLESPSLPIKLYVYACYLTKSLIYNTL